ncbi:MAG: adenine-specific methyltransferase EcoRI family protein [Bacteroidales bacterium]|nr:adenine-specific methyltransferase EcoRI family protein [Bacteroidales bacterium]
MQNKDLANAKNAKKDEFYTQFYDIEREIECYLDYNPDVFRGKSVLLPCDDPEWSNFTRYFAQNFERLGLRRLVSTSYAIESKQFKVSLQTSLFEEQSPLYDADKSKTHGKIFILDSDKTGDGHVDLDDLKWQYLDGDGDFRSDEVCRLRDEADIIVTNPPFSLFREFFGWIMEAKKQFLIIGNMNAVTYKEIFPHIKENRVWYGESIHSGDREFAIPDEYPIEASGWRVDEDGRKYIRVKGVRWYTNLEHGRRHKPMDLMTMADNRKYSKHRDNPKWRFAYLPYDNYDAIEVPFSDAIPSDYDGVMGVPISWLDFYCPEQFEILWITQRNDDPYKAKKYTKDDYPNANDLNARSVIIMDGKPQPMYPRILIRKRK